MIWFKNSLTERVHICYRFEKFKKSGKCRIRIKIRIRNSGKKIFFEILFFNCEQFLLNTFFSKMVIYPKKVCFLHFSCAPASSSKPNCLYNLCSKSGQKIGKELDHLQVSAKIISGKKPDPENPGKIRIWNFWILRSDFKNGQYLVLFYKEILKLFCNFGKFWQLSHWDYLG